LKKSDFITHIVLLQNFSA